MKSRPAIVQRLVGIYETSKKWIVSLDLFLILVLLYFGEFLGPLRDVLLPAAVVSIVGILLETLQRVEAKVSRSARPEEFPTISEALPMLADIVGEDKHKTTVEIIAATGGTTISTLLPTIVQSSPSPSIEVSLHVADPKGAFTKWCPRHWPQETEMVIERIRSEMSSDRVSFNVFTYETIPALHGVMLNRTHLLLGFFGWRYFSGTTQLSGAERPHRYFSRKEPASEYFFDLFEDWLEHCPCRQVHSSRRQK